MSDEKIVERLKKIGIPVYQKRIYESELKDYNYFIITPGKLYKKDHYFYREINVHYVFEDEQKISDLEIVKNLETPGFKFEEMVPEEAKIGETDEYVEVNTYKFMRLERYE